MSSARTNRDTYVDPRSEAPESTPRYPAIGFRYLELPLITLSSRFDVFLPSGTPKPSAQMRVKGSESPGSDQAPPSLISRLGYWITE